MNYELFDHGEKKIFLVDMTKEIDHYFSELVRGGIEKYLKEDKKIGIIVNKKGFNNGIICYECGKIPQCDRCSVSISYHKNPAGELMGICHICKTQYLLPEKCEKCGSHKIKGYGLGTQQVAERLEQEFGVRSVIVESGTVGSKKKILDSRTKILDSKKQIIIGTSLLAQPIMGYDLDLLIFLTGDMGLNIPDYSVNERNFTLLYEAFTKHKCGNFVVQTMNMDQFSIRSACKLDKEGFWKEEMKFREKYLYTPFGEICVILYKDEIEQKMFRKVDTLYQELLYLAQRYQMKDLEIYSTPPLIYKMFGKYRYNIILKGKEVRNFMDVVYTKLDLYAKGFRIDWMAGSIV